MKRISPRDKSRSRSGQALLEFAIISFVFTFLLGSMLALGFLFFSANVVQQAADVGAMELARHPYSPTGTFSQALLDEGATNPQPLFDEQYLVCEIGGDNLTEEDLPLNYTPSDLQDLQDRMPLINRLLFSLYIFDPDFVSDPDPNDNNNNDVINGMIRYPGTIVRRVDDDELIVVIPIIGFGNRDTSTGDELIGTDGEETISKWRRVVEEVIPSGENKGPYSITASEDEQGGLEQPGMVALRINYPYQSAALVAYVHTDANGIPLRPTDVVGRDDVINLPVRANDNDLPPCMTPVTRLSVQLSPELFCSTAGA